MRQGQVFFIHNRIQDLEELAFMIKKLVPDARIGIAHGQLAGEEMEDIMMKFIRGEYDVLVSTTIVESGLDIPNANTILINQAHTYGLSDLHQMRGRVGRSNRKAFCYLLAPPLAVLPTDARKRLEAMEEFSDLGSGLQLAMRDLDIRGAGDILGQEQSGFIAEIGYDVYTQILGEAIREMKSEFFPELSSETTASSVSSEDCQVDTDEIIRIPDTYISNVSERLRFYQRVSEAKTENDLLQLLRELQDRFGLIPLPVLALLDTIRIRELAKQMGWERVSFKDHRLKLYFISDPKAPFFQSDKFAKLLQHVNQHSRQFKLKQLDKQLVLNVYPVESLKDVLHLCRQLEVACGSPDTREIFMDSGK